MGIFWGFGMSKYNITRVSQNRKDNGILCLCSHNAYFILQITANGLKEKSIHMYPHVAMHTFYYM